MIDLLFSLMTACIGIFLYRGAFHRAIGAKNTAVTCLGPEHRTAGTAGIEIKAGVLRHGFFMLVPAVWTGDCRQQYNVHLEYLLKSELTNLH